MAKRNIEEISRRLSHTLDSLGYSQQMVSFRQDSWKIIDQIHYSLISTKRSSVSNRFCTIVGSKREGTSKIFESDLDRLEFWENVLVVEDNIDTRYIPEAVTVLRMVPCKSHPGHCKYLLKKKGFGDEITNNCFYFFENDLWLSSKQFNDNI